MDAKENSKEQDQQQHSFPYLLSNPSITLFTPNSHNFSTMEFNVNRTNSNFFVPCKDYSDAPPTQEQYSVENYSETDSSSEVDVDDDASEYDEKASLEELLLLNDEKAKEKIELLAALVGVDTKEQPLVVLTEVVRVLKNFNSRDQ